MAVLRTKNDSIMSIAAETKRWYIPEGKYLTASPDSNYG
jgi:hypothetical protein